VTKLYKAIDNNKFLRTNVSKMFIART